VAKNWSNHLGHSDSSGQYLQLQQVCFVNCLCKVSALENSHSVLVESGLSIVLSGAQTFQFSSLSMHKGNLALYAACSVWCATIANMLVDWFVRFCSRCRLDRCVRGLPAWAANLSPKMWSISADSAFREQMSSASASSDCTAASSMLVQASANLTCAAERLNLRLI
jgi:hypothetical protein